jgi:hypothetical protein
LSLASFRKCALTVLRFAPVDSSISLTQSSDRPQGGQLFRRKRFHHLPAPLEFIDFADELQDLGRDGDISDPVSADIHLYPFLPIWD